MHSPSRCAKNRPSSVKLNRTVRRSLDRRCLPTRFLSTNLLTRRLITDASTGKSLDSSVTVFASPLWHLSRILYSNGESMYGARLNSVTLAVAAVKPVIKCPMSSCSSVIKLLRRSVAPFVAMPIGSVYTLESVTGATSVSGPSTFNNDCF